MALADRAADAVVAAPLRSVDRAAQRQRRLPAEAARRHLDRPSPRPLARGDRAAHRREPRRRPARAAGTGSAASRAAARPANRATADGPARAARCRRGVARRSRRCSALVATSPYSRLPVYRGSLDRVIGILHTKDVVIDYIGERPRASIAALLRPIVRVRETMPADRLLAFLRERRSHQALVEDDDGRIVRTDHARGRRRRAARRRVGRVQGRPAARDPAA